MIFQSPPLQNNLEGSELGQILDILNNMESGVVFDSQPTIDFCCFKFSKIWKLQG